MTGRRAVLLACLLLAGCGVNRSSGVADGDRLCGTRSILGAAAEPIPGRIRGCGLADGVKVSSVSGVRLSSPATMDCPTARALDDWVRKDVSPAFAGRGDPLVELWVMAGYACRPRNGIPGNRISEHGRGKAIDIGGFRLASGAQVTVLSGWRSERDGKLLRDLHAAACGPFGTVLGPRSDVFHQTHFHLDTARHRSGPYCR